jgi:hypothetical protein
MSDPLFAAGLQITKFGDWKQVEAIFANLSQKNKPITRDAARGARFFAERFRTRLVEGVLTKGSRIGQSWPQVSHKYAHFKIRQFGVSPKLLGQASGIYLQELSYLQIQQRNHLVTMKFRKGALNRKAWKHGISLKYYSQIFEEGYDKIPARPLWNPSFKSIGGFNGAINTITYAIKQRLTSLGIDITFKKL